jgi:hypothetical protein
MQVLDGLARSERARSGGGASAPPAPRASHRASPEGTATGARTSAAASAGAKAGGQRLPGFEDRRRVGRPRTTEVLTHRRRDGQATERCPKERQPRHAGPRGHFGDGEGQRAELPGFTDWREVRAQDGRGASAPLPERVSPSASPEGAAARPREPPPSPRRRGGRTWRGCRGPRTGAGAHVPAAEALRCRQRRGRAASVARGRRWWKSAGRQGRFGDPGGRQAEAGAARGVRRRRSAGRRGRFGDQEGRQTEVVEVRGLAPGVRVRGNRGASAPRLSRAGRRASPDGMAVKASGAPQSPRRPWRSAGRRRQGPGPVRCGKHGIEFAFRRGGGPGRNVSHHRRSDSEQILRRLRKRSRGS